MKTLSCTHRSSDNPVRRKSINLNLLLSAQKKNKIKNTRFIFPLPPHLHKLYYGASMLHCGWIAGILAASKISRVWLGWLPTWVNWQNVSKGRSRKCSIKNLLRQTDRAQWVSTNLWTKAQKRKFPVFIWGQWIQNELFLWGWLCLCDGVHTKPATKGGSKGGVVTR